MTYDARQIANWFIKRAQQDDRVLSIMLILKLTYIAHGKHLEKMNTPLFSNEIQAWRFGPIIVDIYQAFRRQGMKVSVPLPNMLDVENPLDIELLEEVWNEYSELSTSQLSKFTHISGGPWHLAVKIGGWYAPIPSELILQYYRAKAAVA
ncbi:MAG: DUF4065 domain-containing protein [Hyphomicrobiales bacterium]|nr:DUF4065 domain-containing protein [Hyphomicrobiales bacterium]